MTSQFFEHLGFARVDELMRPERSGLAFLGRRSGKRRDLSAKGMSKLQGQVSQAADPDNPYAR